MDRLKLPIYPVNARIKSVLTTNNPHQDYHPHHHPNTNHTVNYGTSSTQFIDHSSNHSTHSISPESKQKTSQQKVNEQYAQYRGTRKLQSVDLDHLRSFSQNESQDNGLDIIYDKIQNLRISLLDQQQAKSDYHSVSNTHSHQSIPLRQVNQEELQWRNSQHQQQQHQSQNQISNNCSQENIIPYQQKMFIASPPHKPNEIFEYDNHIPKENLEPELLTISDKNQKMNSQQPLYTPHSIQSQIEMFNQEKIRGEMELKYQSKINELEKKASQLDKSMMIIDEMKQKFTLFEQQQLQYNQLMNNYNVLMQKFEEMSQRQQTEKNTTVFSPGKPPLSSSQYFTNPQQPQVAVSVKGSRQIEFNDFDNNRVNHTEGDFEQHSHLLKLENEDLRNEISMLRQGLSQKRSSSQLHDETELQLKPVPLRNRNFNDKNNKILNLSTKSANKLPQTLHKRTKSNSSKSRQPIIKSCTQQPHFNTELSQLSKLDLITLVTHLQEQNEQLQVQLQQSKKRQPKTSCTNCDEMKQIYTDRTQALESMCEHWKAKTQMLVSKYYKSLQLIRDDYNAMKQNSMIQINQSRQFVQSIVEEIMKRQNEISVYYEKKLQKSEHENKKLKQRIIKKRYDKKQSQ